MPSGWLALGFVAALQLSPKKPVSPINDPISVKGCLRGTTLTILATDAVDLSGAREVKLTGPRGLLKQLADHRNQYIEVVGVLKAEGGNSDVLDTRRKQKVGTKTTISVGAHAEQSRGEPTSPRRHTLELHAFEPLMDACPAGG
jgi:hypothetical protein